MIDGKMGRSRVPLLFPQRSGLFSLRRAAAGASWENQLYVPCVPEIRLPPPPLLTKDMVINALRVIAGGGAALCVSPALKIHTRILKSHISSLLVGSGQSGAF